MTKGQTPHFYVDCGSSAYICERAGLPFNENTRMYKHVSLSDVEHLRENFYVYCTPTYQGEELTTFPEDIITSRSIERTDPILVSIVETMGSEAASDRFAELYIEELVDGIMYKIDEYDGMESLITEEDDDWITARPNPCQYDIEKNIKNLWATMKPESIPDPDHLYIKNIL
jgi:hypothetical protein